MSMDLPIELSPIIALMPGESGISVRCSPIPISILSSIGAPLLKNAVFPTRILEESVMDISSPSKVGRHFRTEKDMSSSRSSDVLLSRG